MITGALEMMFNVRSESFGDISNRNLELEGWDRQNLVVTEIKCLLCMSKVTRLYKVREEDSDAQDWCEGKF